MLQYNPTVSGSLTITGSLTVTNGVIGTVSGVDVQIFSSSINQVISGIQSSTESSDARLSFIETFTSSTLTRLTNIESKSASVDTSISNINQFTASNDNTSLNSKTGSYATTGSNSFYGTQVFSGSVFIANDLVVQGSSSIQYISASSVSIGTNIVQLNTANPSVRFAGLTVQDSGSSAGVTGSMLWDSLCNRWIYSNPSTIGYSGGMLLSGPRTQTLGTEPTLTCNYIAKSGGGDHLYDSCIIDDGTTVCVNANLKGSSNACFSNSICSCASNTIYAYFDGNNTVLPNPTDRPHIFRTSSGGLGLSANNEGAVSQPISMFTCGAQRFTILPNGNVGINTNNPLSQLDVNVLAGGARRLFVNYADSLVTIKSANDTSTAETLRIWGDNIIFNVVSAGSGVEAMRITNTCRVGIGTQTPCAVLHISNSAPYIYLTDTSTSGARPTARIINGDVGTCQSLNFGFACNDGTTCGLDVLVLNERGNVGIGTNSPGTNLEICTPSQNCGNLRFYNGYNSGANCYGIEFYRNYDAASNELGGFIKYNRVGGSSGDLIFAIGERAAVATKLRIEYTGVSCFASDVCVGGNLVVNGGTIGVNCNTTTNSDARINFYTRSTSSGDRVALYGYNLCAPTTNNEITYQALGFCTAVNQGYVNFQTKNTSAWCNAMTIINGRVGIGNSSPLAKLHVTTSGITASAPSLGWPVYNAELDSNARTIYFDTDGNGGVGTAGQGASLVLLLGSYYDSRVVITPPGNGGGSPADQGTGRGKDLMLKAGTSDNGANYKGGRLYLNGGIGYTSSYGGCVGDVLIQTIGSGGNVGIGTSSPSYTLHVNGTAYATGAAGALSDIRRKQCIQPLSKGLAEVMRLNPVEFAWKDEYVNDCGMIGIQLGFIAQEVQEILPTNILTDRLNNDTLALKYNEYIPILTKAIQEQQCRIKLLESCLGIS
jgi:hypothetical protein